MLSPTNSCVNVCLVTDTHADNVISVPCVPRTPLMYLQIKMSPRRYRLTRGTRGPLIIHSNALRDAQKTIVSFLELLLGLWLDSVCMHLSHNFLSSLQNRLR